MKNMTEKLRIKDATVMYAEQKYTLAILNGTLMFRINRETGETWVFAKRQWNPITEGTIPFDKTPED